MAKEICELLPLVAHAH